MSIVNLILKPGRDKSLLRHHPWVYSGSVNSSSGLVTPGETVRILSDKGNFLAWAAYNPFSQIIARAWSFREDENINEDFLRDKLISSVSRREELSPGSAVRLVFAESDGLPGFILDRYDQVLVAQFLTAGSEYWRDVLIRLALEVTGAESIYERSDVEIRTLEKLPLRSGFLEGRQEYHPIIEENFLKFEVDIVNGHKTGFYLDQRNNRFRLKQLAKNRDVLDCFCYSGGFTVNLLAGGASSVASVDISGQAINSARKNVALNGFDPDIVEWHEADAFQLLRNFRDRNRHFDMIILDPPKFASSYSQVENASRGYKDINLLALKLLRPGGILATFSCSGGVDIELFRKIVSGAAADARVDAQIIGMMSQSPDHPILLSYPESFYLKGFLIRTSA